MTALHELGLAAAARAIRNGEVPSEAYVGTMLEHCAHADLNAFITIDEASVLGAAGDAECQPRAARVTRLSNPQPADCFYAGVERIPSEISMIERAVAVRLRMVAR